MVNDAVAGGAKLIAGGKPLTDGGFTKDNYYAPTLLDNVTSDMPVGQEEPSRHWPRCSGWGAMKRRSRLPIPRSTGYRRASLRETSRNSKDGASHQGGSGADQRSHQSTLGQRSVRWREEERHGAGRCTLCHSGNDRKQTYRHQLGERELGVLSLFFFLRPTS